MNINSVWFEPLMLDIDDNVIMGQERNNMKELRHVLFSLLGYIFDDTRRLKFLGYREKTTEEIYRSTIKNIDILKSDFIPVQLIFDLDGEKIFYDFEVPFLRSAEININSTLNLIRPVIKSDVCTIHAGTGFVDLYGIKLYIVTSPYTMVIDGVVKMKAFMTAPDLYKPIRYGKALKKNPPLPIMFLVFEEMGAKKIVEEYIGKDYFVRRKSSMSPPEGYVKFKTMNEGGVEFVISREKADSSENIEIIMDIISSVICMGDVSASNVISIFDGSEPEAEMLEFIFLTFFDEKGGNSRYLKMLESSGRYLDPVNQEKLKTSGIFVSTFAELVLHIIKNKHKSTEQGFENKNFDSTFHLLHPLMVKASRAAATLDNRKDKDISPKLVHNILRKTHLYPKTFMKWVSPPLLPITRVDSSIASKYIKGGSGMEAQSRGQNVYAQKNPGIPPEYMELNGEQLLAGNVDCGPDGFPVPISTLNIFAKIENGKIIFSGKNIKIMKELNQKLSRKKN